MFRETIGGARFDTVSRRTSSSRHHRERVETVTRREEEKKNDISVVSVGAEGDASRRTAENGGDARKKKEKPTSPRRTTPSERRPEVNATAPGVITRSRARARRTRVHSDGAVRVRDCDQVHAAEWLIGAGPVQRPLRVRGRARRRDLRGEINGHLAGAGVARASASVPSRALSRPITGGGCA